MLKVEKIEESSEIFRMVEKFPYSKAEQIMNDHECYFKGFRIVSVHETYVPEKNFRYSTKGFGQCRSIIFGT